MLKTNRGLNQESIQSSNRALLLELIRKARVCSRAYLSKQSKLQQTTVTYIINDFIKLNLVKETGLLIGNKGRRSIGIEIERNTYGVLGIRIARTGYSVGIFNLAGECVRKEEFHHKADDEASTIITNILDKAAEMQHSEKKRKILAVGVAVPGPFNMKSERIVLMTEVTGWNTLHLREAFEQELGLPVYFQHDACAGVWAQLWHNKKIGHENILAYISVGEGVGSGILINGATLENGYSFTGEIGHMSIDFNGVPCECGNKGCLEKYTSAIALTKTINHAFGTTDAFSVIAQKIKDGNESYVSHYLTCCDYLGIGLVNVINCFNPDAIVIGDEVAKIQPDLLLRRVQEKIHERSMPEIYQNVQIMVNDQDLNAELYGAAIVAVREIYKNTEIYFSSIS
ncbi:MAG: ROK family protein [Clostridiaceae bacterium]